VKEVLTRPIRLKKLPNTFKDFVMLTSTKASEVLTYFVLLLNCYNFYVKYSTLFNIVFIFIYKKKRDVVDVSTLILLLLLIIML